MPWLTSDAIHHTKLAITPQLRMLWTYTANNAYRRNISKGMKVKNAEVSAIKQANSVVRKSKYPKHKVYKQRRLL